MTPRSTFEDRLDDWIEDGPTAAPGEALETVLAAFPSIPQRRGARRIPWRIAAMYGPARAFAGLAIALGLGAAVLFFSRGVPGGIGGQPSPSSTPSPQTTTAVVPTAATETPIPTPTATPSPTPTAAAPTPTPTPAILPCDPVNLAAHITLWDGAAGQRIAHVELTNAGSSSCILQAMAKPQLVDGRGSVLIDGTAPGSSAALTVGPGGILQTLVQDGNYCGPQPVAPVTVAFVLGDGRRLVATPFSATDVTLPPCNGPGLPADISMHPWAP